jgi:hypothetical protein
MEIELSAPFASRAMISMSEYFRFPKPKTSSTSLHLSLFALLSCCLWASLISGFFGGLPNLLPDCRMLSLVQKFQFLVLV